MTGQARVEDAWDRIESWLREHAPHSHGLLRPPATIEQIQAAEQAIGVRFGPELRALYLIHDGVHGAELEDFGEQPTGPFDAGHPWHRGTTAVDFMPNGQAWLPLEHVITAHGGPLWIMAGEQRVPYVPVTASANYSMMDGLYLDPAEGKLGTWADAEDLHTLEVGLPDWLEEGAAALEEGRVSRIHGLRPYLSPTGDGLGWHEDDLGYEQDGWRPVPDRR